MPAFLVAGTTWQWTERLRDVATNEAFDPGGGATVAFHLNGKTSLQFAASDNGDGQWLFSLGPSTAPGTDDIVADGGYRWFKLGTLSSKVYALGSGVIDVLGFPDTDNGKDNRTHAEKMLAAIEAELEARVPGTGAAVNSFSIGTRQFENVPLPELMTLRAKYAAEVAMQRYGKLPDVEAHFVRA